MIKSLIKKNAVFLIKICFNLCAYVCQAFNIDRFLSTIDKLKQQFTFIA